MKAVATAPSVQRYTPEEDKAIRASWPDVVAIAAELGRTELAVRARGRKLGLPCPSGRPKRPFTDDERQAVRDRYGSEGAKPLARDLGRTRADIVALAARLGVGFDGLRRWTAEDDRRLVELRQAGATSAAIAEELGRSASAVNKRAEALDLTKPGYDKDARRRQLVMPRQVSASGCEVRWARVRLRLGEHGWPPDLNPKEVAILNSLTTRGPQTRPVLSASIGEPVSRPLYKRLMTHGGRSAVARLLARGLVARLFLTNGRKRTTVYTLTRSAMEQRGTFQSVASFNKPIASTSSDTQETYE